MRKIGLILCLAALFVFSAAIALPKDAIVRASQDSSGFPSITVESYTYGGVKTYYSGQTIPVGSTVDFRVWVDLYNNDPVKIAYADGATDTYSFGGAFSHDFLHTYNQAGGYVAEAYMPTDSGTFTGFATQPVYVGTSGGGSQDNGQGSTGSTDSGSPDIFTSIGQTFGLTGDTAFVAGVMIPTFTVVVAAGIIGNAVRIHKTKQTTVPHTSKKQVQQPPSYQQPQPSPQTLPVPPMGYPITGGGQPLTGTGITGSTIPVGLPSINLRANWTVLNPGSASLLTQRQLDLQWDDLQYDKSAYRLEGYEIWKTYDQYPTARLGPNDTTWTHTFKGDVQGVTIRATFVTPQGDYQYVIATTYPPL